MFSELLKAPVSRLVIFLCVVTLLACPGALIIWMMDPSEFKTFNAFQLVVLSVALIMPFIILNAVVVCVAFALHRWIHRMVRYKPVSRPREAVVAAASVFAGAVGTAIPAYAPIIAHLFGRAKTPSEMAFPTNGWRVL
jgi:membrane protein implicated in regulation of membrane protease activity